MEPTDRLGTQRDEFFASVCQQPQRNGGVVEGDLVESAGVQCGESDRHGIIASVFLPWPWENTRTRAASLAGTSTTR
jgi:hypothetical protein